MQARSYKPDPRLVPPVGLAMAAGLALLALEGVTQRGFLMLLLLSPFFYLGAEILARKITVDSTGLTISRLSGTVRLDWSDIQSVDVVRSRGRLFVLLETEHRPPVMLTNTISPFNELVDSVLEMLPPERITAEARDIFTDRPSENGPTIQAWIVCAVFTGMVVGKMMGYG